MSWMRPRNRARTVRHPNSASVEHHSDVFLFSAAEIATLRKEAQAFKSVRAALRSPSADAWSSSSAAKQAFDKVRDHLARRFAF